MVALFTLGCGSASELGTRPEVTGSEAVLVEFPADAARTSGGDLDITDIAVGTDHCVALVRGKPYRWGLRGANTGRYGRYTDHHMAPGNLVQKAPEVVCHPSSLLDWGYDEDKEEMPAIDGKVVLAASGGSNTFLVTANGDVYLYGDLRPPGGPPDRLFRIWAVQQGASLRPRVVGVSAGWRHCLLLLDSGQVHALGDDEYGQCAGCGSGEVRVRMPSDQPVIGIAAGTCHSLAWDSSGVAYAWGHGGAGRLGTGSAHHCSSPCRLTMLQDPVSAISCGANFTIFATGSGHGLWACGGNQYGQLGLDLPLSAQQHSPRRLDFPRPTEVVVQLACGTNHALCMTQQEEFPTETRPVVWAWGCSASGQCGKAPGELSREPPASRPIPEPLVEFMAPSQHWPVQLAAGRTRSLVLATTRNSEPRVGMDEEAEWRQSASLASAGGAASVHLRSPAIQAWQSPCAGCATPLGLDTTTTEASIDAAWARLRGVAGTPAGATPASLSPAREAASHWPEAAVCGSHMMPVMETREQVPRAAPSPMISPVQNRPHVTIHEPVATMGARPQGEFPMDLQPAHQRSDDIIDDFCSRLGHGKTLESSYRQTPISQRARSLSPVAELVQFGEESLSSPSGFHATPNAIKPTALERKPPVKSRSACQLGAAPGQRSDRAAWPLGGWCSMRSSARGMPSARRSIAQSTGMGTFSTRRQRQRSADACSFPSGLHWLSEPSSKDAGSYRGLLEACEHAVEGSSTYSDEAHVRPELSIPKELLQQPPERQHHASALRDLALAQVELVNRSEDQWSGVWGSLTDLNSMLTDMGSRAGVMVGMPLVFAAPPVQRKMVPNLQESPPPQPTLHTGGDNVVKRRKQRSKDAHHPQTALHQGSAGPVESRQGKVKQWLQRHTTPKQRSVPQTRRGSDFSLPSSDFFTFSSQDERQRASSLKQPELAHQPELRQQVPLNTEERPAAGTSRRPSMASTALAPAGVTSNPGASGQIPDMGVYVLEAGPQADGSPAAFMPGIGSKRPFLPTWQARTWNRPEPHNNLARSQVNDAAQIHEHTRKHSHGQANFIPLEDHHHHSADHTTVRSASSLSDVQLSSGRPMQLNTNAVDRAGPPAFGRQRMSSAGDSRSSASDESRRTRTRSSSGSSTSSDSQPSGREHQDAVTEVQPMGSSCSVSASGCSSHMEVRPPHAFAQDVSQGDMVTTITSFDGSSSASASSDHHHQFAADMVQGRSIDVLKQSGDISQCFCTMSPGLDSFRIKFSKESREFTDIPLTSIVERVAGADTHGTTMCSQLETPLDENCVTWALKDGNCITFRFPNLKARDTFMDAMDGVIEELPSSSRQARHTE